MDRACCPRRDQRRALALPGLMAVLAAASVGCDTTERPASLVDAAPVDTLKPGIDGAVQDAARDGAMDAPEPRADGPLDGGEAPADVWVTDLGSKPSTDALNDACCADAVSPVPTRPIAPRSGGFVASRRPVFRWTPQAGAESYRVEVGNSREFTTPTNHFTTAGPVTTLATPVDLSPGRIWWRVVPLRGDGTALAPTATWVLHCGRVANDLNGDGNADVVIGAPEHDTAQLTDAGRVHIFFGGTLDPAVDITFDGIATGESFGRALSTAGDVNGDGFADLAVAAPFGGAMQAGRVAIYLGGATLVNAPAVTLLGPQPQAQFGRCVSIVGDVNGDGFDDVLVATPFFRGAPGVNAGQAWIYLGGTAMNAEPDVQFTYTNANDQLGFSCGSAGDGNGDGFADIAIGAPRNGVGGVDGGAGYVWWGGAPMDTGVDLIVLGSTPGARLGDALTTLGDANADGYADLAFGAPGVAAGGPNAGAVVAISGGTGVIPRPLFTLNGTNAERLGTALAGGADLDADGFDDLVVGTRDNATNGPLAGRAYVYRGGLGPLPRLGATYAVSMGTMAGGDEFGFSVAVLGDANADAFDEVLVGAPNAPSAGAPGPGRVYLFPGGPTLVTTPRQTYAPMAPSAFGLALPRR